MHLIKKSTVYYTYMHKVKTDCLNSKFRLRILSIRALNGNINTLVQRDKLFHMVVDLLQRLNRYIPSWSVKPWRLYGVVKWKVRS
jgi:hypothetical protein